MPYPRKMPQIEVYLILISDGRLMDGFRTDKHLSQTVGWGAVDNYDDFFDNQRKPENLFGINCSGVFMNVEVCSYMLYYSIICIIWYTIIYILYAILLYAFYALL